MARKRSKEIVILSFGEKRRTATQRILDSMPAMVDAIKAEREREAYKQRQGTREREKSKMVSDSIAAGRPRTVSNTLKK